MPLTSVARVSLSIGHALGLQLGQRRVEVGDVEAQVECPISFDDRRRVARSAAGW
jgi:hypothetical protein